VEGLAVRIEIRRSFGRFGPERPSRIRVGIFVCSHLTLGEKKQINKSFSRFYGDFYTIFFFRTKSYLKKDWGFQRSIPVTDKKNASDE